MKEDEDDRSDKANMVVTIIPAASMSRVIMSLSFDELKVVYFQAADTTEAVPYRTIRSIENVEKQKMHRRNVNVIIMRHSDLLEPVGIAWEPNNQWILMNPALLSSRHQ